MSSTQSVPASDASKAQLDAATQAMESLAVKHTGDQEAQGHNHADDGGEDDEDDDDDAAAQSTSANAGGAVAEAGVPSKKKKKKSKSKGKGKAALDKLKDTLTGSNSKSINLDGDDTPTTSSVAGKKPTPPISDALYKRILEEAKKNLSSEEAAKLDRQAVAEMVECKLCLGCSRTAILDKEVWLTSHIHCSFESTRRHLRQELWH